MHRTILRCPHRSIRGLFCGYVIPGEGTRNGPHLVESFQTIAGLEGSVSFGCSRGTITNSLGLQIVSALQLGHRNQASSLLSELDTTNHVAYSRDVVHILDYCARSPDPLFVMEAWKLLEGKNVNLSKNCYMLIIRALCNGGYLEEALHLVKYIRENNRASLILPLYNYILSACAKMKDAMHANQCLNMMDYQLLGKNEVTYTTLLKLAVWEKNLSAVHEIWKDYIKYYNSNIMSLRKFIWSFTQLKDLESAYKALQRMVALALKEDTFYHRTVEGKTHCVHLDIPIPSNSGMVVVGYHLHEEGPPSSVSVDEGMIMNTGKSLQSSLMSAESVMSRTSGVRMIEESQKDSIKRVLRWSFNDVIHACGHCRNGELAEQLIVQMQNLGLEPSSFTYDGLVRAVIRGRDIDDTMGVLKVMQQRKLKPCDSTLSALSVGCSRALDLDLAEALLNQITKTPYAYPFNAFLAACDTTDEPERAVKMFANMRELNIRPDIRTYELLFALFGNVNAPYEEGNLLSQADVTKRIKAIELDMLKNGIQHSHLSMKNLLKALGTEGMVQQLLQYLHAAEQRFSHHDFLGTDIYNTVLHSLVEAQENHIAIQMFRNMKLCGLQPDAATYNIMIDCCSNIRCFQSACALVSMMLRNGFSPQTLTYTAVIKILLEHDAFDDALDLLDQTISEGNEPDVLLFNTVLRKADIRGRIDVIELVVEMMYREKIQPDPSTCSYVFNAYVERGFHSTAFEALQVLSMRMISHDLSTLKDVREEYEDLIVSEEPGEAETNIVEIFTHSENLAAALLNLRCCSIVGFLISWVPNENPWAKRLASSCTAEMTAAL